jgi:RNA polymerase sigma factor (sigma-70 family)
LQYYDGEQTNLTEPPMSIGQRNGFLGHLRGIILARDGNGQSDAQLLRSFLAQNDEAAFAALVRRHGPMVLGVCRRLLRDPCDAEDAFQATFLVLVRKAASLGRPEQVSNWLYGVAYRTALRARAERMRQHSLEKPLYDIPADEPVAELVWQDLRPILDEELNGLPEKYRVPLVLCYFEGKTKRQAARHLGKPEGTVSTQLARGRDLLRERLVRRGLTLSAGVLAATLSHSAASAAVPGALMTSTVRAAVDLAAGKAAAGAIAAPVAVLTEGVMRAMFMTKLKFAAAVMLAVGLFAAGTGGLFYQSRSEAATNSHSSSATAVGQRPRGDDNVADSDVETRRRIEMLVKQLNDQLAQLKDEEDVRRQKENRIRQEKERWLQVKDDELERLKATEFATQLKKAVEDERQNRAFRDIEQALRDLKQTAVGDKPRSEAVAEFEKAFQTMKSQLQGKAPLPKARGGGGGGGPGKSPFGGGFSGGSSKGFEQEMNPFGKGGGFAGSSTGFGGGSFGSSSGSMKMRDAETEKQLHDALQRVKDLEDRLRRLEKNPSPDDKPLPKKQPSEIKDKLADEEALVKRRALLDKVDGGLADKLLKEGKLSEREALLKEAQALYERQIQEAKDRLKVLEDQQRAIDKKAAPPISVPDYQREYLEHLDKLKAAEQRRSEIEKKNAPDADPKAKNPPPGPVKGIICDVTSDGLVRINIGSDHGLQKGHTLEVYRLGEKPVYLGTVRIVETKPNESVGKQLRASGKSSIQTEDLVTNQLFEKPE